MAAVLHKYIPDSDIVFNQKIQHCACAFANGVYDITGRISAEGFYHATKRDIAYMKKNFVPSFDVGLLEKYMETIMAIEQDQ